MNDNERDPQIITLNVKLKAFEDAMKTAKDAFEASIADLDAQISNNTRKAGK